MDKKALVFSAFYGAMAVVLGALGAHALKSVLTSDQLASFETAVKYQMYHSLGLLILSFAGSRLPQKYFVFTRNAFISGVILFSGSLYILSLHGIIGIENYKWIGPITPIGGLLFILGWISLLIAAFKAK